jgi:Family of unknown function (DUF6502)
LRSKAASVAAGDRRAQVVLRASLWLMAPVVRWLLRSGVQYGAFAAALKTVFVEVASEELRRGGKKATDSALSVLSGVHRKDVRAISATSGEPELKSVSLASQVFTRWLTAARYRDASGKPRSLPRLGDRRSFEALAREVSTDVHPRTVLDELVRLGLVRLQGEMVELKAQSFVPTSDDAELLALFAANAGDHLAAAVHNLTTTQPRFLEQSVFADGLSEQSAKELHKIARVLWAKAFERMVAEATKRCKADHATPAPNRIRFGVYYYGEPQGESGKEEPR